MTAGRAPADDGAASQASAADAPGTAGPRPGTQAAIGCGLLLVAVVVWFDAARLPAPGTFGVGPSAAMRLVAGLLVALGIAHVALAWRRRARAPVAVERGNRASLAWVMAALAGLVLVLQFDGGFVPGAAWLFVATARGFGEPLSVRSVGLGFGLSALVWLFFTRALSLTLPAGPLERLIG